MHLQTLFRATFPFSQQIFAINSHFINSILLKKDSKELDYQSIYSSKNPDHLNTAVCIKLCSKMKFLNKTPICRTFNKKWKKMNNLF